MSATYPLPLISVQFLLVKVKQQFSCLLSVYIVSAFTVAVYRCGVLAMCVYYYSLVMVIMLV